MFKSDSLPREYFSLKNIILVNYGQGRVKRGKTGQSKKLADKKQKLFQQKWAWKGAKSGISSKTQF